MSPRSFAFDTSRNDLDAAPIEPSHVKKGAPTARAKTLTESPDARLTSGLWDCTAGTFKWIHGSDEIVHILEGEVHVSDGETTHHLVPGSVAYFPCGLETEWNVPTYVKKAFVLRAPQGSRLRRAASGLKRRLFALAGR